MKNRIYALILILVMSMPLAACGNDNHTVDIPAPEVNEEVSEDTVSDDTNIEETIETESEPEEEAYEEPEEDYSDKEPVWIVLSMVTFNKETIEEYVAKMQEDNPDTVYEVYDDKHYMMQVGYAEYMEAKKNMKDVDLLDKSVQEYFSDEQFGGAFIRAEYDDLLQDVKLYVNRELYEKNIFACGIGSAFYFAVISDTYQAYNDIAPEDRKLTITYIDNDTMEEFSSTDNWGN